jgi:hypothetical protein
MITKLKIFNVYFVVLYDSKFKDNNIILRNTTAFKLHNDTLIKATSYKNGLWNKNWKLSIIFLPIVYLQTKKNLSKLKIVNIYEVQLK